MAKKNTSQRIQKQMIETARKKQNDDTARGYIEFPLSFVSENGTEILLTDLNVENNSSIEVPPIMLKEELQRNTHFKQVIPPELWDKIRSLFDNQIHHQQFYIMCLYYSARLTQMEIAHLIGNYTGNYGATIGRSIKRATEKVKEGLTEEEYDSVRWFFRDLKPFVSGNPPFQATHR